MEEKQISSVMKEASFYLTKERMGRIMNLDGRVNLYANKFGAKTSEKVIYDGVRNLFVQAMTLLDKDDNNFLQKSAQTIKEYGWLPPT